MNADETTSPATTNDGTTEHETLLLLPLEDVVVFPTMDITLPVDVGDDERVLLADVGKVRALTGWVPATNVTAVVSRILGYWRGRVAQLYAGDGELL